MITKLKVERTCQGGCDECKGEVIPVLIKGNGFGELEFDYCENAIEKDVRNGFDVKTAEK